MALTTEEADIVIVGSGPVGATFARLLTHRLKDFKIVMLEAGPRLTSRAGMHVKNIVDPAEQARVQQSYQRPGLYRDSASGSRGQENTKRAVARRFSHLAQPGTFLLASDDDALLRSGMPAAAVASSVGGMGAYWRCACPRPAPTEKAGFIDPKEWEDLCATAEELLHVSRRVYPESPAGKAILAGLAETFDPRLSSDRQVGTMPLACVVKNTGERQWSGTDVVLGPLALPDAAPDNFQLQPDMLCLQLAAGDHGVGYVIVRHLPSGATKRIRGRIFIVAADAFRTPQLLWASGFRGTALGHFLNEHAQTVCLVQLRHDLYRLCETHSRSRDRSETASQQDATLGIYWVPFHEPNHPFHGQVMHFDTPPLPTVPPKREENGSFVGLGWFCPKQLRYEDYLEFDEHEKNCYGMPRMMIHYAWTEKDRESIVQSRKEMECAAQSLGSILDYGKPRTLPAGSSLHYQGTTRMGQINDGSSVCDPYAQVWGTSNLFVAGNGVIPTATACNPTLSSVALAVRSCEKICSMLS